MTPSDLAIILSAFLGVYGAFSGAVWLRHLIAERRARRIAMALNLSRRAGPPVLGGLVLLVAGGLLDLVGQGPVAALLICGGWAFGFHRGLADMGRNNARALGLRVAISVALALAFSWQVGFV